MDREKAIEEVEWYRKLIGAKLRVWGSDLPRSRRELLLGNLDDVLARRDNLVFKSDDECYYIGEVDEEGIRHGYGVCTFFTKRRDRWVMQAGFWHDGAAMGSHTLYDADCPDSRHFLAEVYYKGERRRQKGIVQYSLSERGLSARRRVYKRYEHFSYSTLIFGAVFIFFAIFFLTRRFRLALLVVAVISLLYIIGALVGRQE